MVWVDGLPVAAQEPPGLAGGPLWLCQMGAASHLQPAWRPQRARVPQPGRAPFLRLRVIWGSTLLLWWESLQLTQARQVSEVQVSLLPAGVPLCIPEALPLLSHGPCSPLILKLGLEQRRAKLQLVRSLDVWAVPALAGGVGRVGRGGETQHWSGLDGEEEACTLSSCSPDDCTKPSRGL